MSDTSSTIKRSVGLVKTCSSYKNKTLVHNTILPRPIVIMLKCKSNQSFDTFSLIRCFSDILIRMSESYTQMMLLISDENVNNCVRNPDFISKQKTLELSQSGTG